VTWVDSHCHLPSLSGGAEAALDRARAAGVERVVCVGTDLASSQASVEVAACHVDVVPTVGLHPRDAWNDTFRVLDDAGAPERTVFHCFTGGPDQARRALSLGAYISFSGIVSFKNADDVRAAAMLTPIDRMLVETDAPYLAPVPHRGRENEPAWVADVGAALAAATGRAHGDVATATRTNTETVFQLSQHAS
jgi:TatD DNase family protein